MPTIRIDPGERSQKRRQYAQQAGAAIGTAVFPLSPVMPAIGAYFGDLFGQVISKKEPTFPILIDTETNRLTLETPDYRASVNTKTRALAPKIEARNEAVRAALQSAWDTGVIPSSLPKRYADEAAALLSQRELLRVEAEPAPVSPIETEGAQYPRINDMGIVPPGGFAGFAQMTPASKAAQGFGKLMRAVGGGRRRKRKAGGAAGRKRKRAKGTRKGRRKLVKGSAAAKRYMAALRRKRK